MKIKIITILAVAGIIGGTFLILNNYLRPEFGNAQIITHEYNVGGERVIINEQPPIEKTLFGGGKEVFKPEVKLEKWGDETYIKIWTDDPVEDTATIIGDKVISKSKDGKKEYHLYPLGPREFEENGHTVSQLEQGGFEFEIILNEDPRPMKTGDYKIKMSIETKGLKFYYQSELTQEEKDRGNFQPENVVGSYAVYHESKQGDYSQMGGKNYRAGKAFHIYRPKIIDAMGNWAWSEQKIIVNENGTGQQIITISQDFLNNAVYPVRHAGGDTFGYETLGTAGSDTAYKRISGSQFTGAAGTADSLTIGIECFGVQYQAGIYKHSDSSKVGVTEAIWTNVWPKNWATLDFASPPSITAVDYVLVAVTGYSSGFDFYYDDGVGTTQGHYEAVNPWDEWPNTASFTHEDRKYSIYCTYTPGAPPPPEEPERPYIIIIK